MVLNVFPNSPVIDSITVKHHGQIHKGKLYYLYEFNSKGGGVPRIILNSLTLIICVNILINR
ncbi:50S ribosomal protein L19 [Gilliamella apicola]|uniref:50S ribosomal protein L19 n=1 Tax=Gilliamella sp. App6-5 TaxID=3120232 RepID=UPI00114709C0